MNADPKQEEQDAIAKAMSIMGKRRSQKLTAEQRQSIASQGGTAAWANVDKEERSKMLRERAAIRWQKRKKQAPAVSKIIEDHRTYGRKGGTFAKGQPCWYAKTPDDQTPIRKAWFKYEEKLGDEAVAGLIQIRAGSWFMWFVCASADPKDVPSYAKGGPYKVTYVPAKKGTVA